MGLYSIAWKNSAAKELKKLPKDTIGRILKAVEQLAMTPYPPGVKNLIGAEHTYRIRAGDYRIIYSVTTETLIIEIIKVGHRKDVYGG